MIFPSLFDASTNLNKELDSFPWNQAFSFLMWQNTCHTFFNNNFWCNESTVDSLNGSRIIELILWGWKTIPTTLIQISVRIFLENILVYIFVKILRLELWVFSQKQSLVKISWNNFLHLLLKDSKVYSS